MFDRADALWEASQGGGGMFQAIAPRPPSLFGSLFQGQPMIEMGATALLQTTGAADALGLNDMLNQGIGAHRNLMSTIAGRRFARASRLATQQGFSMDRENMASTILGTMRARGQTIDDAARAQAAQMARDVENFMPMIASFSPDMADQLHGAAGSRGMLASALAARGEQSYSRERDQFGLTGGEISDRADKLYSEIYGPSPDTRRAGAARMRGFGAGAVGTIIGQMEDMGLSQSDDKDVSRTAEKVKRMTGALSAVRDLLGDAGHPNAPVPVLFNALKALTQGGIGRMSPEEMESQVRTMGVAAKRAGVSLDAMTGIVAQTAEFAQASGTSRSLAPQVVRGSLNFSTALASTARLDMYDPGRLTREGYTLKDAQLRVAAAASPMARLVSTALKYEQDMLFTQDAIDSDSDLGKLLENVRRGGRSAREAMRGQTVGSLRRMMGKAGISSAFIQDTLADKETLDEIGRRNHVDAVVRGAQGREIQDVLEQQGEALLRGAFAGSRRNPGNEWFAVKGRKISKALMEAPAGYTSTEEGRKAVIQSALAEKEEDLKGAQGRNFQVTEAEAAQLASRYQSRANTALRRRTNMGLAANLDLHREETFQEAGRIGRLNWLQADLEDAFSRAAPGDLTATFIDALQKAPRGKDGAPDVQSLVKAMIGGGEGADIEEEVRKYATGEDAGQRAQNLYKHRNRISARTKLASAVQGTALLEQKIDEAKAEGDNDEVSELKYQRDSLVSGGYAKDALREEMKKRGFKNINTAIPSIVHPKDKDDLILRSLYLNTGEGIEELTALAKKEGDKASAGAPGEKRSVAARGAEAPAAREEAAAAPRAPRAGQGAEAPPRASAEAPAGAAAPAGGAASEGPVKIEITGEVELREDRIAFDRTSGSANFSVPVVRGKR